MPARPRHLSRPLYEGLPWLYMALGLAALFGSYLLAGHGALSLGVGALGLLVLLGGVVVLLRRRDYRELRSQYGDRGDLDPKDL
jgi:uncharacterized membrane protein